MAEVLEARFLKVGKELLIISYQASDICYTVAEVLEARFLKVGKELSVISCQAGRRGVIIYPVAEVLEAKLFLAIHHLRNHINQINHSSDN